MILTIPFLIGSLFFKNRSPIEKGILVAGLIAAAYGVLLAAVRQPLWVLGMVMVATWIQTGFSPKVGLVLAVLIAVDSTLPRPTNVSSVDSNLKEVGWVKCIPFIVYMAV